MKATSSVSERVGFWTADVVALPVQEPVHACPARAIDEPPVHEDEFFTVAMVLPPLSIGWPLTPWIFPGIDR